MAPTVNALFRHIVTGSLWRPLKKRAEQELIAELTEKRYPSFPFISPDTFRAVCDVIVEENRVTRRQPMGARRVIYFDLADVTGKEANFRDLGSLELLESELDAAPLPPVVVMTHGDILPPRLLLSEIASRSKVVFAINLNYESENLRTIPLGIENFSRNSNGRLGDFLEFRDSELSNQRKHDVFAAFEVENNKEIRGKLATLLKESRFGWTSRRMHPRDYRQCVKDSLFVLSPPGRGLDCHRTWEAIYLGSVPVILEGTLPPSIATDLPITVVPRYEEFLKMGPEEMLDLFVETRSKSERKAFAPYWIAEIEKTANES